MSHPLSRYETVGDSQFVARLCASLPLLVERGILTRVPTLKYIKSNDPLERPVIDPHYFEEEYGNAILERP
jgi:hypothetical protein